MVASGVGQFGNQLLASVPLVKTNVLTARKATGPTLRRVRFSIMLPNAGLDFGVVAVYGGSWDEAVWERHFKVDLDLRVGGEGGMYPKTCGVQHASPATSLTRTPFELILPSHSVAAGT